MHAVSSSTLVSPVTIWYVIPPRPTRTQPASLLYPIIFSVFTHRLPAFQLDGRPGQAVGGGVSCSARSSSIDLSISNALRAT